MSAVGPRRPSENWVLAALPGEVSRRLLPHLESVQLAPGAVLSVPGVPMLHAYFPLDAVASTLRMMPSGEAAGVAIRGNREAIGLPAVFGLPVLPFVVLDQVPGDAFRLPVAEVRSEIARSRALRTALQRAVVATFVQSARIAGCNRKHPADQRLAFWLLMTQDRAEAARLPLTQEALSVMLGVRRQTVTEIARTWQDAGLIRVGRGAITILDRPALERASCPDYRDLDDAYRRLFRRPL
jgi:CRP-like cAMP-binding protein